MIVTSIEAYNYPIYGVQFHPEKTLYEFSYADGVIPRTAEARQLAEDITFNFVEETKKSQHYFNSQDEERSYLIQNMYHKLCKFTVYGADFWFEYYSSTPPSS